MFVKEGAPAATENKMPMVKNCYFSADRTIVLWDDGTKTVVQCQPGDEFDPEKGIFAAIAKRAYGNTGKFNDVMRTANDMGEYNFIKEMAKNPDAMTKLIEDLFYGLANSDEEDDEDDVCDKSLPSAKDDTISRQAALSAMDTWDKFGCDPDGKLVSYDDDNHYVPYVHYDDMIHVIKHLPSAQPEIIRCKDCKFYSPMNRETKTGICNLIMHQNFGNNWFCAGAERRPDESDRKRSGD